MKRLLIIALILCAGGWLQAAPTTSADELYKSGQYAQAAKAYELILKNGRSAALLYNIGNCYYKTQDWGKAIMYYEKALKLAPTDEDILFNLKMANAHTSDKAVVRSPGLGSWFYSLLMITTPDVWTQMALAAGIVGFVALFMFRRKGVRLYRHTGIGAITLFVVFLLFGWFLNNRVNSHHTAIVLEPTVEIKTAPQDKGKAAFILHEGARVSISREDKDWMEIQFDDTHKGWIKKEYLGII